MTFDFLFVMGPAGVEPATNAFRFVLVSQLPGLSLHHGGRPRFRWWPSSLYTFLIVAQAWLGITSQGFPDFDHIRHADFSSCARLLMRALL